MNKIVVENALPGSPPGDWDIPPADWGSTAIEGFATSMSVNLGETIEFKVRTSSTAYHIDIYRLGWYGGAGARKVATVLPSVPLPQAQPNPFVEPSTGLVECSAWSVSAAWDVPSNHVSGIHLAKLVCDDIVGTHHVVFVVRDDSGASDVLLQTSDTTWQAYNAWGGAGLYENNIVPGLPRAYKVSYDRPFATRMNESGANYLFNAEYPLVRWLEANGFDVSYCTGGDTDRSHERLLEHRVFVSVGHDEYWSGAQRRHVEMARDAGVHLVFLSGNEIYWRTRWEPGLEGVNPHRTLVCYKETQDHARTDPSGEWTGTWRDPRFSARGEGTAPENALSGSWTRKAMGFSPSAIQVPSDFSSHRFWRDTSIATLPPGGVSTLTVGTLGYEYDEVPVNHVRPPGLAHLSSTVEDVSCIQDHGSIYGIATATHAAALYRHASGALVFASGTVQWVWGLDDVHDVGTDAGRVSGPAVPEIRQAMVNLLADMGVQPETLQAGLVVAVASTDTTPPTSTITVPLPGCVLKPGKTIEIAGTAADMDGRVAGVEISVNDGVTWRPALGRESWSLKWTPTGNGPVTIRSRPFDDSGNLEDPSAGVAVTVGDVVWAPILLVVNSANGENVFSDYLTEILRGEGLVSFRKIELATLLAANDPSAVLGQHRIVLLADTLLDDVAESTLRSYVAGGGALIAMRPDPRLADVFGLHLVEELLVDPLVPLRFVALDTSTPAAAGLTAGPILFHGAVDRYDTIPGADVTVVAWLMDDLATLSTNPAVTIAPFGSGTAVAFAFDLAQSVVLARQGNPEWKNSEGDGARVTPSTLSQQSATNDQFRPMDMFCRLDGRTWFEPTRLRVPHADELQRLLANLILDLAPPLPRMWYLPAGKRALIVNTGDGEDYTTSVMQAPIEASQAHGGRFTTYLRRLQIPSHLPSDQERRWRDAGHEFGVHVYADPFGDAVTTQTARQLHLSYDEITSALEANYQHPARTARSHTIEWVGWVEMARIESEYGTSLDLNYYHYYEFSSKNAFPDLAFPTSKAGAGGYFTGSGLAQRFCDETGTVLPIYQLLTEWPDEFFYNNGFAGTEPFDLVIEPMLTAASTGYFSAFVVNVHHGPYVAVGAPHFTEPWVHKMWDHAQARAIPMWSAERLLDFVEARNGVVFSDVTWADGVLSFRFSTPGCGQDLVVMLPGQGLTEVHVDGAPAVWTSELLMGRMYGMVALPDAKGSVVAVYLGP